MPASNIRKKKRTDPASRVVVEGLKAKQKTLLSSFCRKICRAIPALKKGEISFIFISDRAIRRINKNFLSHDCTTDVLSFGYEAGASSKEIQPRGDIYISLDYAKRLAKAGGYAVEQELALYALHGALHLAGFDDSGKRKKEKMFAMQRKIFRKLASRLAPPDHRA